MKTEVIQYRIKSTNRNSSDLGLCECCQQSAGDVHLMTTRQQYVSGFDGRIFWGGPDHTFGHLKCLQSKALHQNAQTWG